MCKFIVLCFQFFIVDNFYYFVFFSFFVGKFFKFCQVFNSFVEGWYKFFVNDFLIKVIVVVFKKVFVVNSLWCDGVICQFNNVDVFVVVVIFIGLIIFIVINVEFKGLEIILVFVKEFVKKVCDNKFKFEEYQGGIIIIFNMGMNVVVECFIVIINFFQVVIFVVGSIQKVVVLVENEDGIMGVEWEEWIVVIGSFDYKVVDGVVGVEWMCEFKKVIENFFEFFF